MAHLVAAHLNNLQIAENLFVGRRTVESHLTSIYRKLDIKRREQLIRLIEADGRYAGAEET